MRDKDEALIAARPRHGVGLLAHRQRLQFLVRSSSGPHHLRELLRALLERLPLVSGPAWLGSHVVAAALGALGWLVGPGLSLLRNQQWQGMVLLIAQVGQHDIWDCSEAPPFRSASQVRWVHGAKSRSLV